MIWFTSDHHFGHENIIKYANRPFDSVNEMDRTMIERWNKVVDYNDLVYHLGDFTLGKWDIFERYYKQLNGNIFFIPGNHDWQWTKIGMTTWGEDHVLEQIIELKHKNMPLIVMCHYQMRTWNKAHFGSFHLYGHAHGKSTPIGRSMEVSVETNDYYPYSLIDIYTALHNKKHDFEGIINADAE